VTEEDRINRLEKKIDEIEGKQDQMLIEFAKYKGAWGGILLVVSALSAALYLFFDFIKVRAGL
jgi:hypothetical protein